MMDPLLFFLKALLMAAQKFELFKIKVPNVLKCFFIVGFICEKNRVISVMFLFYLLT